MSYNTTPFKTISVLIGRLVSGYEIGNDNLVRADRIIKKRLSSAQAFVLLEQLAKVAPASTLKGVKSIKMLLLAHTKRSSDGDAEIPDFKHTDFGIEEPVEVVKAPAVQSFEIVNPDDFFGKDNSIFVTQMPSQKVAVDSMVGALPTEPPQMTEIVRPKPVKQQRPPPSVDIPVLTKAVPATFESFGLPKEFLTTSQTLALIYNADKGEKTFIYLQLVNYLRTLNPKQVESLILWATKEYSAEDHANTIGKAIPAPRRWGARVIKQALMSLLCVEPATLAFL